MIPLPLIINDLRNTSSHKEKVALIQKHKKELMMPLYYCYSPFRRFHIRQIPSELRGRGALPIGLQFYELLSRLTKREITGDEARKTLFNNIETLSPVYARLAICIVKKNLNIGCNAGLINRAFKGELIEVHKVMLAKRYEATRALEFPLLVSPKIDGVRAVYRKNQFYTRNGHEITGLDHLKTTINFKGITDILDGELHVPGLSFDKASGIIRSNKDYKPAVHYAVFDLPNRKGTMVERAVQLEQYFPMLGKGFDVEHVPHIMVHSLDSVNLAYRKYRSACLEGVMLKTINAPYQFKRSADWLKMKPLHDEEYLIVDTFGGEGKYQGMLGGIILRSGSQKIRVGSGFTDEERRGDPDHYIGRWATIEAMEKTAAGKLRHPIFKGIRWDI